MGSDVFLWRYFPQRWWERLIPRACRRYVRWNGTEQHIWQVAPSFAPFAYRWLGSSLTVAQIDYELGADASWAAMKAKLQPGDKIWPFMANRNTMAMRAGLIIIRRRTFVAGIVLLVS